jgi:hypothetical protein
MEGLVSTHANWATERKSLMIIKFMKMNVFLDCYIPSPDAQNETTFENVQGQKFPKRKTKCLEYL